MIDLWFADDKIKKAYTCSLCVKNPQTARERRCQEPGFENLKKPRRIDNYSLEYGFCPGKATWYEEAAELFEQCRVALETGIMPSSGSLSDQDALFYEVFPFFVMRWRERAYHRVWADVREFTKEVLEGIFGKKKGGK